MVNTIFPKPSPVKLCWIHMLYTEGQLPLISCNQLTGTVTSKVSGRFSILCKNHGQYLEEFRLPGPTLCGRDMPTPLGSICGNSWEFPLPHSSMTSPDPQVTLGKRWAVGLLPGGRALTWSFHPEGQIRLCRGNSANNGRDSSEQHRGLFTPTSWW